jgi:hypothetical protein
MRTLLSKGFLAAVALPILVVAYTNAWAQNRPWCDSGVSQSVPDTKTSLELKRRLAAASNVAEGNHGLDRLEPISLAIALSGTVQPDSVAKERDQDITFCLQLDDESQKKLQQEIGNPSRVPKEIHVEMVAYARDSAGNAVFRGWQGRAEDRVLFDGSPVEVDLGGGSILFKNLPGTEKHLDGKRIEVTGSLLIDPHSGSRPSRCGFLGCLEIHPLDSIKTNPAR